MTQEQAAVIQTKLQEIERRLVALEDRANDDVLATQKQLSSMKRLEREVRLAVEKKTGTTLAGERTNRKTN